MQIPTQRKVQSKSNTAILLLIALSRPVLTRRQAPTIIPPHVFPGKILGSQLPIKQRILCVDDYVEICTLICIILADFDVVVAFSRTEGLRKVKSGLFDLYLLDYSLPDGTGLELATLIRQFDDSTPILICTSSTSITHRDVSRVGAQGLVAKDKLSDDLLRQVSRILNFNIPDR